MEKAIQIKQLDQLTVQCIRQRLNVALNQMSENLSIMIELGSCNVRTSSCRFQLNLTLLDSKGNPIQEEIEAFKHNAVLFGFEDADLGKEFNVKGQTYTISGFSPKSQKAPVLANSSDGKSSKFACRVVLEALGRKVPSWM